MTARSALAVALLAALGCRSARPAPTVLPERADQETALPDAGTPLAAVPRDAGSVPGPGDLEARASEAWTHRDDPAALDRSIELWEEAVLREGEPAEALLGAARARRERAQTLLARANSASAEAQGNAAELLFAAGQDAQVCSAEAHRSWAALAAPDAGQVGALPDKPLPSAVEAIYLEAVCAADWARTQGFTQLVERRAEIRDALQLAADQQPDLDNAGPDRELGRLLSSLPAYAGGDLREARLHLEAAIGRAPLAPANHLLYARAIAVKLQDRALFEAQLGAVLEAPAVSGEDRRAVAEAHELLLREDDLFGPSQAAQKTPGVPAR